MFKLASKRRVLWPITINVSRPDGSGSVDAVECKLLYELLTMDEIKESATGIEIADKVLASKILGWEGVVDENDNAVPFSESTRDALLKDPAFYKAASKGLYQASRGEAAVKNS